MRLTSISVNAEVIGLVAKFGADTHLGILSFAGRTMAA
jgi:hypothetical protein